MVRYVINCFAMKQNMSLKLVRLLIFVVQSFFNTFSTRLRIYTELVFMEQGLHTATTTFWPNFLFWVPGIIFFLCKFINVYR